jgi:ABC-type histidine transport system ATPase subunit
MLEVIRVEKPDVVIMTGPFVDMSHSLVGETTLESEDGVKLIVTHEAFFANKVAAFIEALFADEDGLNTQFVLVPSLDDAVSEWV